jgi:hypothetical protein
MKIQYPSSEFDAAVAAVCHGQATDAQVSAVNELLRSSAARDEYILRLEVHSRLASESDLFAPAATASGLRSTTTRGNPRWITAAAVAACLALVTTLAWGIGRRTPASATSNAVAMLNETANARWARLARSPEIGAPLEPGWLKLEDGLAQIVFYSGARLVVEGPAHIQLVSANHAVIVRGKITAEVPPQARGFRIDTPQGKIIDLGTSFGLDVKAERAEVHVFKGEVQVEAAFSRTTENLLQGAAAVIGTSTPPRLIRANAGAFASLSELQAKSSAADARRLQQWRVAGKRLNGDPSLLVRFDFDSAAMSEWQIQNLSQQGDLAESAVIVGCRRGEGRWLGKKALEFQCVSDRLRVNVKGEFESLTMATWVRVQGLDRELNSLFMSDGFAAGSVHWLVRKDGVLGLTVVGAQPGKYQIAASPPVLTLDRFGMWVHLAVVLDGGVGRVVHYVNGRRVGHNPLQIKPPFRIGTAELGNWNPSGYPGKEPFMIRNFSGAIDEFCLLDRALDDRGIEALYVEGRPGADTVLVAMDVTRAPKIAHYDHP